MKKAIKIALVVFAIAAVWFTFSFRNGKIFLKLGAWESCMSNGAILHAEADGDGGSSEKEDGETAFG